ncbi:histidine kinase dimerization/phosphoacceptor domain -containing protein [Terrarubrum flagellatum]|uniref:histidine kinase dimerization/phosphoacceptor domain -containing protein n=1 Tax=Terrirubrum flagellatum TaxID=2895980 RepID=UPI0031454D1E
MNRLRARILIILVAAALPAILLVSVLAYRAYDVAKASAFDALERDVELMTSRFAAIPVGSARMAWLLASAVAWDASPETRCEANIRAVLPAFPGFNNLFVYRNDALICSAADSQMRPTSISELGVEALRAGESRVSLLDDKTGAPVIYAAARGSGAASDFVAILTVDRDFLNRLLAIFRSYGSSRALLLDKSGKSLGAPLSAQDDTTLQLAFPLPEQERVSFAFDSAGRSYVITSRKLASPDIWLVTRQRDSDVLADARNQLTLAVIAPVLTLLLVGFAVWLGLTRVVIHWVVRLTKATRAYAEGNLGSRVGDASAAPSEIAELAQRFDGLADRMAERSVELEGEVFQKRRYIRELHHRVKNNLQVIASLLALQKRNLSREQRAVLRFPEDRVNAMAAAYGVSYAQTESGFVGVLAVVREVITRLQPGVEGRHPHVSVTITGEDRQVDLDMAIAIAMLLAELAPRFLDASVDEAHLAVFDVVLDAERLAVDISSSGISERSPVNRLSDRFTRAYMRQLGAELDNSRDDRIGLVIPMAAITAEKGLTPIASIG